MESLSLPPQVWSFGAYGTVLVILVLVIKSMMSSFIRNIDLREKNHAMLVGKLTEAIGDHTKALEGVSDTHKLQHIQTLNQIRRSEGNIKKHIDRRLPKKHKPKNLPLGSEPVSSAPLAGINQN